MNKLVSKMDWLHGLFGHLRHLTSESFVVGLEPWLGALCGIWAAVLCSRVGRPQGTLEGPTEQTAKKTCIYRVQRVVQS